MKIFSLEKITNSTLLKRKFSRSYWTDPIVPISCYQKTGQSVTFWQGLPDIPELTSYQLSKFPFIVIALNKLIVFSHFKRLAEYICFYPFWQQLIIRLVSFVFFLNPNWIILVENLKKRNGSIYYVMLACSRIRTYL